MLIFICHCLVMLLSSKCRVVSWCRGLRASEGNTLILLFVRERDCSCSATSEQHGKKENNRFENKEQYEDRKCSATSEQNENERKHNCLNQKQRTARWREAVWQQANNMRTKKSKTRKAQGITKNPKRTARVRQIKKDVRSTEV
jgi:hypothetical protein